MCGEVDSFLSYLTLKSSMTLPGVFPRLSLPLMYGMDTYDLESRWHTPIGQAAVHQV
jgi:hypothetical protein